MTYIEGGSSMSDAILDVAVIGYGPVSQIWKAS